MEYHAKEDTMSTPSTPVDHVTDLARRGQEATARAVRGTAAALQSYAEAVVPRDLHPVDPQAVTAVTFDLAEQLLRVQRQYVATAVELLTEAGQTATAHATAAGETLKARTEQATEHVIDFATETTRRAATTARNGVSV